MKKPYISKIKSVGKFTVFYVDGEYIRTNIDKEFTNFGQHYHFGFIPKKEFWIDKENAPSEIDFYISHLIIEYYLMDMKIPYEIAIDEADLIEKSERLKSKYFSKINNVVNGEEILNKIHIKLLNEYSTDNLKVWIVDGELVRGKYFIDFTEGGHEYVYNFIPKGEVWIDNDLFPKEICFVLLHELHERNLMKEGSLYGDAHNLSSIIEHTCRQHPSKIKQMIKKELIISSKDI